MENTQAFSYYLIVGEITYREEEGSDVFMNRINGILKLEPTKQITTSVLADAQRVIQINLFKQFDNKPVDVLGITIMNIMPLAQNISDAEFHDFEMTQTSNAVN